jgi:putative iron-regulated protein
MKLLKLAACITSASLLAACGGDTDTKTVTVEVEPERVFVTPAAGAIAVNLDNARKVLATNADIAFATYSDSVITAEALKVALTALKNGPTAETLTAAKAAWLVAREPYGQTEVYRFRNSPIDDNPVTAAEEDGPEGSLNAWPLGEALIDYVETNDSDFTAEQVGVTASSTGINANGAVDGSEVAQNIIGINTITIDDALLDGTLSADDEHDVIAGYHAIEFLLWGQDLNTSNQETTDGSDRDLAVNATAMGGQRPLADFVSAAANDAADRRHQYLEVAVDKIITELTSVRDEWNKDTAGSYYNTFTTIANVAEAKTKLTEILVGMGTLSEGELAGERMQIAFTANSQEDEHSCFSDNTHRDIWLNAEGVSNSFTGTYAGYDNNQDGNDNVTTNAVTGYGIEDYLKDADQIALATQATEVFAETEANYTEIDDDARYAAKPFDVQIMNPTENNPVYKTIKSLNVQSIVIQNIATGLGLSSVVDEEASGCDTTDPLAEC